MVGGGGTGNIESKDRGHMQFKKVSEGSRLFHKRRHQVLVCTFVNIPILAQFWRHATILSRLIFLQHDHRTASSDPAFLAPMGAQEAKILSVRSCHSLIYVQWRVQRMLQGSDGSLGRVRVWWVMQGSDWSCKGLMYNARVWRVM